jgi:hypothetical protein
LGMPSLDSILRQEFGEVIGFALLVFEFGNDQSGNYISNVNREDMIKVLRETADRLEKRQEIPPAIGTVQ